MRTLRPPVRPIAGLVVLVAVGAVLAATPAASPAPTDDLAAVSFNENTVPAGAMRAGTLELRLDTRMGAMRPYRDDAPAIPTLLFGEEGRPLRTPGPMIRVTVGTPIHVTVRNAAASTLVVHGLAGRRTAREDSLVVPAGASRDARFTADEAGTYFYWGTTTGAEFTDRLFEDAHLNGAFIVDPVGAKVNDRIFLIQFVVPGKYPDGSPNFTHSFLTFNGRPWPYTERLAYEQGDSVHWRFINASADVHPLHLHGFYFRVTSRGDWQRDTLYWTPQQRMGVTEMMDEATTMAISWKADRPGGWVFHCHLNYHVLPNPRIGAETPPDSVRDAEIVAAFTPHDAHGMRNHAEQGMGGLLLALEVHPKSGWRPYDGPRERLRLTVESDSQPADSARRFGYALAEGDAQPPEHLVRGPGPTIVLHRGKPTTIMVHNRSPEPTQVHWHGLEIDSYYDGVAGISSNGGMVSPMIMPGDSFPVTLTPPRAGSFMYHTHINDVRQQSHGLYGAIVVLDSAATWDPTHDLIFQVASNTDLGPGLNGSVAPAALTLRVGERYRFRLMNISLDVPFNQLWLSRADGFSPRWTPVAKDGFDLPASQRDPRRARQGVSIGETYDFTARFAEAGEFAMEARIGNGTIFARQVIHVVK